jgi:uncharacterized membrane protein
MNSGNLFVILGLSLNLVGTLCLAFAFSEHTGEAYTLRKGRKVFLAEFRHPRLFCAGIVFLALGFAVQLFEALAG